MTLFLLPFLLACVDQAQLAHTSLENAGYSNITVREGVMDDYAITATHPDGRRCTGTVKVESNWNGSQVGTTQNLTCPKPQ